MMLIPTETRHGINVTGIVVLFINAFLHLLVTVKSFVELTEYVFKIPGVKFFLSERISQDPLENFFGCQRQRGRTGENPNVDQFCKNTQALRVINSVCAHVPRGNCRGRRNVIDIKKESKALPKRRRQRSKPRLLSKNKENNSVEVNSPEDERQVVRTILSAESTVEEGPISSERELSCDESTDDTLTIVSDLEVDLEISDLSSDENVEDNPKPTMTMDKVSPKGKERLLCESDSSNVQRWEEETGLDCEKTDDEIVRGYGIILRRKDLWTLKDQSWLNDQVSVKSNVNLNYFLNM